MKILRVFVCGFLAAGLVLAQHHTSSGSSTGSAHSSAHFSTGGHVNNSSVANHGAGYTHRPVSGGWHGYGRGRGGIYAYPVYVGGYGFYGYPTHMATVTVLTILRPTTTTPAPSRLPGSVVLPPLPTSPPGRS